MNKLIKIIKTIFLLSIFLTIYCADNKSVEPLHPGIQDDGSFLLSTGLSLTPAGKSIDTDGKPVLTALSPDNRFIAAYSETGNGYILSVININSLESASEYQLDTPLTGICFDPAGDTFYASCGHEDIVRIYSFSDGELEQESELNLNPEGDPGKKYFPTGIAVSGDGEYLVTANLYSDNVSVYRTDDWDDPYTINAGGMPYSVTFHPDNRHIIVGGENGSITIIDLENRGISSSFTYDEAVSSLAITPDGSKIYAAEPYKDRIVVIDVISGDETGSIDMSPVTDAPSGTIPWFLSTSADGRTLYCANSGNNCIAVIDISSTQGTIKGSIPTNRSPVYVEVSDNRLITAGIVNGNSGKLSVIDIPDGAQLSEYTEQVHKNNKTAEVEESLQYGIGVKYPRAVPGKIGEPSLIKHVFYIVKGNTSSDRLSGEDFTPNHLALAGEFTLLNNFYTCGRSDIDGMLWNTAGISIDFYDNLKPFTFLTGQPSEITNRFENSGISQIRHLWDEAADKGITFKLYGISDNIRDQGSLNIPETNVELADIFIRDFQNSIADNSLPQLNVIHLRGGTGTQDAKTADNDLALGRIIETISNSGLWEMAAVFVVENYVPENADQAHTGRSPALVISPFVRRNFADNTMYNNLSILKTIELILGFEPLSQFDAAAEPLFSIFHENPVLTPYQSTSK
ncbi:MAG: beta-propeller fold lactonase family protein [bacterium]|nr:beta-propeller fold lactonase family protein [bacterium]